VLLEKLEKMLISSYEQLINQVIKNVLTRSVQRVLKNLTIYIFYSKKITIFSTLRILQIVVQSG